MNGASVDGPLEGETMTLRFVVGRILRELIELGVCAAGRLRQEMGRQPTP